MTHKVPDDNARMWIAAGQQPALGGWFAVWLLTRPEAEPKARRAPARGVPANRRFA